MDDDYLDLYLSYSEMLQEARAENAKLRNLASDLLQRLKAAESMAEMSFTDARLINRCKELEIEVNYG